MADLAPQERLQPSLLDRLTDDEPGKKVESRERRVLSMRRLRECVLRDLTWLLNADNLAQTEDLSDFPLVASSTLNFGMRDLAGTTTSDTPPPRLEREVRQAILDFEPRILRETLRVHVVQADDKDQVDKRALSFTIEGELWAEPVPLHLLLKSEVDVETGEATVAEASESRGA
jgi:type VI secretion system protein ImpF